MRKLFSAFLMGMIALSVNAQEFGSEAAPEEEALATKAALEELPPETGTGPAIEEIVQVQEEEVEPAKTAMEAIDEYFNSKDDWKKGYDEENDRIIVSDSIEFDIKNPRVSSDFVVLRAEKMAELMLKAKSKIIEQIMSKMSGSRILEVPGNPIAKQLEKEQAQMRKELQVAYEELGKLDAELADALKKRDRLTASELIAIISSWFTSAEKENLAEKYDADKKERYENAKADFEAAAAEYQTLVEKAEALKGTVTKEMKTELSRLAQMPIYGCTILQQAESIVEKNGRYTYQIAILYAWSGEMLKASGEILKGESVKFAPGKKSSKEWLASKVKSGALSQWIGPRQFIDNKGNMWFIGIASAAIDDDADTNEANREIAELEAASEVMFALYADAMSSKTAEKLMRTKVGANGEKATQVLQDFAKTQKESFRDIMISGNGELWSGTVHHEPSDLDMYVVVYGVNSGSVKALKNIQTQATSLGIEVNTYQEMERGRQAQMHRSFENSKNNPAARAAGTAKANADLKAEAEKRLTDKKSRTFKESDGQQQTNTKGKLRTGTQMIIDDED
ncbi:MAG: hypothetical protein MJ202_06880 [Lentisphaeria bacterium]|nr:hypothetical protein [Lentisphaeria bacterium]